MATVKVKLRELQTRVTWLEQAVQELRGDGQRSPVREETKGISERERLLAELEAEGLIRDPTPQELARYLLNILGRSHISAQSPRLGGVSGEVCPANPPPGRGLGAWESLLPQLFEKIPSER